MGKRDKKGGREIQKKEPQIETDEAKEERYKTEKG